MPEYKMYILKDNDRVIDVVRVECVNDTEALNLIDAGAQRHAIEIWQGDRFLARARRPEARPRLGATRPRVQTGATASSMTTERSESPAP